MSDEIPGLTPPEVRQNYFQRRREKVVAEIQANRRGEYVVPTWVLFLILMLMVGGIVALIIGNG